MYRDVLGFSITPHMQRVMTINGCYASIMRAEKKSEDSDRALPPGLPIPVLPVDYLKERPDNWIGGEGSYVCPVDSDWGLWFNFLMNNTSETAVLCSVKGMNPFTGQRVGGYDLQEFDKQCPIHEIPFSTGKFCSKCGFKWPNQNFVADPNPLYVDGYRIPDGDVRQFYFTEEMAKSIPEKVIGKDDTVPAFGFCFYHLKKRRDNYEGGVSYRDEFPFEYSQPGSYVISATSEHTGELKTFYADSMPTSDYRFHASDSSELLSEVRERSISLGETPSEMNISAKKGGIICPPSDPLEKNNTVKSISKTFRSIKAEPKERVGIEVGLGAGARIKQGFNKAKHSVSDWGTKPTGVIRLYFVFQEEFERYVSAGLRDLEGSREGYLEGLPVGGGK